MANSVVPQSNSDESTDGPFASAARDYRNAGWMGVLPLPANQKEAPPSGFHGIGDPNPTLNHVRKWLRDTKDETSDWYHGNIALAFTIVAKPVDVPFIYGDVGQVTEWEHLAIDVDDYDDKHGWDELCSTEDQLGALPDTIASSSRWSTEPNSNLRVFLVPKGFRYHGKVPGCKHIDIIANGLRYMVAYPSRHPSGNGYLWRYGGSNGWRELDAIPSAGAATVLPIEWFNHIRKTGESSDAAGESDWDWDALWDWAGDTFHDVSEPCDLMRREVTKYISDLDASNLHHPLTTTVWRLCLNALEGHSGFGWALMEYLNAWVDVAGESGRRAMQEMKGESWRSVHGALAKVKFQYDAAGGFLPADKCAKQYGNTDDWTKKFEEDQKRIADGDYGGLGPVIGPMHVCDDKPADNYGRHDDGNGQHLVDLYCGNLRYVAARKNWIVWDGLRWHRDNEDRLIRSAYRRVRKRQEMHAQTLLQRAAAEPDNKALRAVANAWISWAKRSGDTSPVKNAIEMARHSYVHDEPVVLSAMKLDGYPHLLGCKNGVIDLNGTFDGGEFDIDVRPPRKEDYVTYNTNVDYIPWRVLASDDGDRLDAFLIWQEYLDEFLPDMELQLFARKVLGHMLIGENPEKKIVFLFGPRDTGKSTLIGAVSGALGDYYGTVDMHLFKQKELNPGLVRAVPHRIVGMSEMEEATKSGIIDANMVKKLTGNDKIVAELKYSNEIYEGRPQFTALIACNNPPKIPNADPALYERLLVVPLDHRISSAKRRYERQQEIERICGVAVLAWLIEGWKDYKREGLQYATWPQRVRDQNRTFLGELNTVQTYIAQYLVKAKHDEWGKRVASKAMEKAKARGKVKPTAYQWPLAWTPEAKRVYEHYRKVTKLAGGEPVEMTQFTRELDIGRTENRKINGKSTSVYVGIKFKEEPEDGPTSFSQKF